MTTTMPFGKYKDRPLTDIPVAYLKWLISESIIDNEELEEAVLDALSARREARAARLDELLDQVEAPPNWSDVLRQVRRELALKFHPDRGGSTEAMQALNACFDRLEELSAVAA